MDEPKRPQAEESPYLKLPWPLVAGGLAAVLLVALAAGVLANRFVRQPTVVLPPPTAVSIAAVTPTSVAAAAATAILPPAVTSQPAGPTGTALPQAQVTPATADATSTTAPAAPAGGSATLTTRPTVSPALAEDIGKAYQRYWQVRAEALFDLDTSRLHEVMAGEHLAAGEQLIQELRAEGRAIETEIEHKYLVLEASNERAEVADNYIDNSVYIDVESHARISEPTADRLNEVYGFARIEGEWKVVTLARAQ